MLGQSNKKKKNNPNGDLRMLVILFIIVIVLAILSTVVSNLDFSSSNDEIDVNKFSTIEEVLKFYGCNFLKKEESLENGYKLDIYATLAKKPYEDDDTSNESFYNRFLNATTNVMQYSNYRIIDEKNDIKIEVQCENGKIKRIYINGIEDYFTYMNSQLSLKDFKEIPDVEFSIDSPELQQLINLNWSGYSNLLGNSEGSFQGYEQFFTKGIKIRQKKGRIYNIVFTKKYTNPVISGIIVREGFDFAKAKFGTPSFEDSKNKIYGYKGKDCYVFFTQDEISIFRREKTVLYESFLDITEKFSNKTIDIYEYLDELTYVWADYDEYIVGNDYFYITYPTKGISVKCNYQNTNAIIIYNNCGMNTKQIAWCLNLPECLAQMQVDNTFEAEISRVEKDREVLEKAEKYVTENATEENPLISIKYNFYMEKDEYGNTKATYFVSKDGESINRELIEYIDTVAWLSDDVFLYSVPNKGIYYYNLSTNRRGVVVSGDNEFKIKSCNNYLLKYDKEEINIEF